MAVQFLAPSLCHAHDSWLIAYADMGDDQTQIQLAFVTGEIFPIGDQPTDLARVADCTLISANGKIAVEDFSNEEQELVAHVTLSAPIAHVAGLVLHPRYIEIEAEHFDEYLRDERAERAMADRQAGKLLTEPGREYYTKSAKTFIQVDPSSDHEIFKVALGHPLEIIPVTNPDRWEIGDEIAVRVLLEGSPAPGLRVCSGHEGLPKHAYTAVATTDREGIARLTVTRPGLWFLRTHTIRHIENRAIGVDEKPKAPKADWESYWASITFRIADPDAETPPAAKPLDTPPRPKTPKKDAPPS